MALEQYNASVKAITTGADVKSDLEAVMQPYMSWEKFLVPAPICVGLLGEMILVSSATDFSLRDRPPEGGFKLIRWPDSFRASLSQVSHAGYDAFLTAHGNMDKIRLMTANVPVHFKEALKILLNGNVNEIEQMLPIPLSHIDNVVNGCLRMSQEVDSQFTQVIALTQEVLEACVNAKGSYEEKIKVTEIKLAKSKDLEKGINDAAKEEKAQLEEMKQHIQESEKQFKRAMDSSPGVWDMIGLGLADAVITGVRAVSSAFVGGKVGMVANAVQSGQGGQGSTQKQPESKKSSKTFQQIAATLQAANKIKIVVAGIQQRVQDAIRQLEGGKLDCRKVFSDATELKCDLQLILSSLKGAPPCEQKDTVVSLLNKAITCTVSLEDLMKGVSPDVDKLKQLLNEVESLDDKLLGFCTKADMVLGQSPLTGNPPKLGKTQEAQGSGGSLAALAVQNAQNKIEAASVELRYHRDQYQAANEKMRETTRQLTAIIAEMHGLKLEQVNFEEIKKVLIRGIEALGLLKEQWNKLVMFFKMIANIIECMMSVSMNKFLEYSKKSQQEALKSGGQQYSMSDLMKDLLYQQAFDAVKYAYLVNMLADGYTTISKLHVMPKLAHLDVLFKYDPATDGQEIHKEKNELLQGCKDAEGAIESLLMEKQRKFYANVNARMNQVNQLLSAIGPPPQSKKKAIENAASEARKEAPQFNTQELDAFA